MVTNTRRRKLNTKSAPKFFGPDAAPPTEFTGIVDITAESSGVPFTVTVPGLTANAVVLVSVVNDPAEDTFGQAVAVVGPAAAGSFLAVWAGPGHDNALHMSYFAKNLF